MITAVEVQEPGNPEEIQELRRVTLSLDERFNILHSARGETWELVSHRLNATLDRTATTLSERMTELEI